MKLNERDSTIIKILLELGMKKELAQNPDAVKAVISAADKVVNLDDNEIWKLVQDGKLDQLKEPLSQIIDDQHRIVVTTNESRDAYTQGKDGKQTFDMRVTQKNVRTIDVNEKGQTVIIDDETRTDGFANRSTNHPFYDPNLQLDQESSLRAYPAGTYMGVTTTTRTESIIEDGVQMEYYEVDSSEKYYDVDSLQRRNNGDKPDAKLAKGEYWSGVRRTTREEEDKGLGYKATAIKENVGKYIRIKRDPKLATASLVVGVNEENKDIIPTAIGKELYKDGHYYGLPNLIIMDASMSHSINALDASGYNSSDIHKVREQLEKPEIVEKIEEIRKLRLGSDTTIDPNSELANLARKRGIIPGEYVPETVEFEFFETAKETSERIARQIVEMYVEAREKGDLQRGVKEIKDMDLAKEKEETK